MVAKGKTIKVFFNENYANLKIVSIDSWSCELYIGERKHIKLLPSVKELQNKTGLYFLCSRNELEVTTDLYIGETEDLSKRLKQQFADKDWWTQFIAFTSINDAITKSHVKYLEKEFYQLAETNIATINLKNNDPPNGATLPHADAAFTEHCKEQIIFILQNLGMLDFTKPTEKVTKSPEQEIYYIWLSKDKCAKLSVSDDKIIILQGSYLKAKIQPSFETHNYNKTREKIITLKKYLPIDEKVIMLNADLTCTSLSQAASIVLGRAANGQIEWTNAEKQTFKQYSENKEFVL